MPGHLRAHPFRPLDALGETQNRTRESTTALQGCALHRRIRSK
jgi:hypothetical protein